MGRPLNLHDATGVIAEAPGVGILIGYGTKPADGVSGYACGCLFIVPGGADGSNIYVNDGTLTSADFNLVVITAA